MERNIFEKQRDLNDRLNRYRDEYYNRNAPSVSDEVYDRLFDELKELEQETGIQMANSPTQTVGYPAVSRLEKTRHEIPLLSLDKTKSSMDLLNFMGEQQVMLMLKLDGLTVKLTYENGELLEAATRCGGCFRGGQDREERQGQEDPHLQVQSQEGLPETSGPSSALHQG